MAKAKSRPAAASPVEVDLFGAPVTQIKERWGRPAFKKSQENQLLVATLRAKGWSQERIARYMRCDVKTLRNHFSRELQAGADLIEGQALEVLVREMRQGKLSAVRQVLAMTEHGRAAPPAPTAGDDPEAGDRPERLGKKEQLDQAAANPPAAWGNLLN
jgi:lambda repressor-like predicted transcriptional regulator